MSDDPFSHKERECIAEVFEFNELTPAQERLAWAAITKYWRETSGQFYAYMTAHSIAARIKMENP